MSQASTRTLLKLEVRIREEIGKLEAEYDQWETGVYEIKEWPDPETVERQMRSLTIQANTLKRVLGWIP